MSRALYGRTDALAACAIEAWIRRCGEISSQLESATVDFLTAQARLRGAIRFARDAGELGGEEDLAASEGWLDETPESITRNATFLWKHRLDSENALYDEIYGEEEKSDG